MSEQPKRFLAISEKFTSIQGEGQTMGKRAIFLRLGGCNLLCKSDTWECDTIAVWRTSRKILFEYVFDTEDIIKLYNGAHLIITGGEPMLQQVRIEHFLDWFKTFYQFIPKIEIETNGTIFPNELLYDKVDYWNVSPKLPSSGVPIKKAQKRGTLLKLSKHPGTIFKFVVSSKEDVDMIRRHYLRHIDKDKIYLMPAGETRRKLHNIEQTVVELAQKNSWNFCTRLHIHIYNRKTGV